MAETIIDFIKNIIIIFLATQSASVFLFLTIEWAIVDYYRNGTFANPTNILDKILNIVMVAFMGSGYYLYNKFSKYNWFTRKLFMLISFVLHGILCIIIFYIITIPLEWIFL